jgi:dihydrofolate synthase/folylpolyglutamate synthase
MSHPPTYDEAMASLSGLIPELFTTPAKNGAPPVRRKFSLDEIRILCAAVGNPHQQFPSVLIAGTNGKGSTAATLASIARASGLRVGLYTSPHLERVNERIRLLTPHAEKMGAGAPEPALSLPKGLVFETVDPDIPDLTFARLYFRVHDTAQQLVLDGALSHLPSYFELLTTLAFLYFAEPIPGSGPVDLAVLEVGMGGRLDATNLVDPVLSVITDISLDHQEWHGNTIAEITREKAGILRPHGTLITLPQHPEANQALGEVAMHLEVRGVPATDYMPPARPASPSTGPYPIEVLGQSILVDSPLKGAHQHRNIALAIAAAVELSTVLPSLPHPITPATIAEGIRTTHWPGRLERLTLPNLPEIILDVAHNPAGAWALRSALGLLDTSDTSHDAHFDSSTKVGAPGLVSETGDQIPPTHQVLVFACLRDKPLREMTQILFPLFDHVILAPIHSPRATDMADLVAAAEATGTPSTPATTVAEALHLALAQHPARIVISGSVYLVGEARHLLLRSSDSSIDSGEARRLDG